MGHILWLMTHVTHRSIDPWPINCDSTKRIGKKWTSLIWWLHFMPSARDIAIPVVLFLVHLLPMTKLLQLCKIAPIHADEQRRPIDGHNRRTERHWDSCLRAPVVLTSVSTHALLLQQQVEFGLCLVNSHPRDVVGDRPSTHLVTELYWLRWAWLLSSRHRLMFLSTAKPHCA